MKKVLMLAATLALSAGAALALCAPSLTSHDAYSVTQLSATAPVLLADDTTPPPLPPQDPTSPKSPSPDKICPECLDATSPPPPPIASICPECLDRIKPTATRPPEHPDLTA